MGNFSISNIGVVLIFSAIVFAALPVSPFSAFINALDTTPFLQYLAWAVPVEAILSIFQAWLVAISAFYVIMLLARWIKLID